jgi:putative transposase
VVDEHGRTLNGLLQEHRDAAAAVRCPRRVLDVAAGPAPDRITTVKSGSHAAALREVPELAGVEHLYVRSAMRNNERVEQVHQPTRVREGVMH